MLPVRSVPSTEGSALPTTARSPHAKPVTGSPPALPRACPIPGSSLPRGDPPRALRARCSSGCALLARNTCSTPPQRPAYWSPQLFA
jgi:hypothetical protein